MIETEIYKYNDAPTVEHAVCIFSCVNQQIQPARSVTYNYERHDLLCTTVAHEKVFIFALLFHFNRKSKLPDVLRYKTVDNALNVKFLTGHRHIVLPYSGPSARTNESALWSQRLSF